MKLLQRFINAVRPARAATGTDLGPIGSAWVTLTRAVGDWFSGAWQQVAGPPDEESVRNSLNDAVVYACVRLLATDMSKLQPQIRKLSSYDVWEVAEHQTLSPLLRRPNHFQTWSRFIQSMMFSRLLAGDYYGVKLYEGSRVAEIIGLDPTKVTPLLANDTGNVFYRVAQEPLARVFDEEIIVAAADMIHIPYLPLAHPLQGTAPLDRAIMSARARQGILQNAAVLNENNSVPPGILIAPEGMTEAKLTALAEKWRKIPKGRVAVLDAAIKFESLSAKAVDSQSVELADLSAVDICIAFGVPPWKLGIGQRPSGNVEALQIMYYQDSLQWQKEDIEQALDVGLDVDKGVYIELDPATLYMMDSKTRAEVDAMLVKGIKSPNESRRDWNLAPVAGGNAVYLQQQNYSLSALDKRDQAAPAPSSAAPSPGSGPAPGPDDEEDVDEPEATPSARVSLPWEGVYDAGREYPSGCFVTHKGSLWARSGKPGTAEPGTDAAMWKLAAKGSKVREVVVLSEAV